MSSSSGISLRHGPHQLAQKLIITTWPLNWERSMVLPPRPESWKPGAGPDEEEASAAEAKTAASAMPLTNPFKLLADMTHSVRRRPVSYTHLRAHETPE